MRTKFKQWAVDYLGEHKEIVIDKIDKESPFFQNNLSIEIGSGKGDFILGYSLLHPNDNFLAVEKVETVAGMMAKKLVEADVKNVLVCPLDATVVLQSFDDSSVNTIFLNFVDPWPKKKHAKRRLTFITFLNEYYRILKEGHNLILKTDNDGLYEFTLEEIKQSKFKLISSTFDYKFDENNDAMTEYERKFRALGQPIHRIVLEK